MFTPDMKSRFASSAQSGEMPGCSNVLTWSLAIFLGVMAAVVFWPATRNDFVNFDDSDYVQSNLQVQKGLTWENVGWAFCHTVSSNWHPVTMLSHMLDCQIYGINPWGHHLTSVLLHSLNTLLLFLLLRRLTGTIWRSAWVAALFAVHPLHVESVAWVAERKDVLSTCFGFLALLFYTRYAQRERFASPKGKSGPSERPFLRSRDYWIACGCFALGLMSKPMLVTLPCVLCLLDYWPLGRFQAGWSWPLLVEKVPFFLLAAASSVVTYLVQWKEGAVQALYSLSFGIRCENAVISYCRYLLKLIWPTDLAVFYPYPGHWPLKWVLPALMLLTGLSVAFWLRRRRNPFLLVGWLWFVGTLVPVIGLVQAGEQSIADRYMYIPSVGIFILIGWGMFALSQRWHLAPAIFALAGSVAVILCSVRTRQQIGYWRNSETLFRHALQVTDNNDVAHNNLGTALFAQGQTNAAITQFQEALRINQDYAEAHMNLGDLLSTKGQTAPALHELQQAVQLKPDFVDAHYNFGSLLLKCGQFDAGVEQLMLALHFRTNNAESCDALGDLLIKNDQTNAAIAQFREAVRLRPDDAQFHYKLGNLLARDDQPDEAIGQFKAAIRIKPDFADACNNLGSLLLKKGRTDEAINLFQEAIRVRSNYALAHYNLGDSYLKNKQIGAAIDQFQTAIKLDPDLASAHFYLGVALTDQNQNGAAISQFQDTIRLQPDYAVAHDKLGIALGATGQLDEAIRQFQEAIRLQPDFAESRANLAIALKLKQSRPKN